MTNERDVHPRAARAHAAGGVFFSLHRSRGATHLRGAPGHKLIETSPLDWTLISGHSARSAHTMQGAETGGSPLFPC